MMGAALLAGTGFTGCKMNDDSTETASDSSPQTEQNITYIGTKRPSEAKAVGDIVFNDGSATPYTAFTEENPITDEQKSAAIAVIFYVGTECSNNGKERTLGVGLVSKYQEFCSSNAAAYNIKITPLGFNDKNGIDNFEQIAQFLDTEDGVNNDTGIGNNSIKTTVQAASLYPAFYFAINYKEQTNSHVANTNYETNWYVPTSIELRKIFLEKGKVNAANLLYGGVQFGTEHWWSSTQRTDFDKVAVTVNFENGTNSSYNKDQSKKTCVIHEF